MPGAQGMEDMKALMGRFRETPPESLGGMTVARVRDYKNNTAMDTATRRVEPLAGPTGDLVMLGIGAVLLVLGAGLGFAMLALLLAVQHSVSRSELGVGSTFTIELPSLAD